MIALTFHKRYFLKTLLIFLALSIAWTFVCIRTNEFTDRDKGLLSGLGFLLLFAASIYFGQPRKPLSHLWLLAVLTIGIFLTATFILGPLIGLSTDSLLLYAIVNSLFVSITMTRALHKMYGINLKYLTMAITGAMLLLAYLFMAKFDNDDTYYLKFGLHPRIIMFNIFQFMLLLSQTIGLTIKKAGVNHRLCKLNG
jgi:hypothetical protein